MQKPEVERLFSLLGQFWPNAQQLKSKPLQAAWVLALEPFAYEDAKAATVTYARKNKFFPDLADITAGLPEIQSKPPNDNENHGRDMAWALPYVIKNFSRLSEEHAEELHAKGLQTFPEAKASGKTWKQWRDEAGDDIDHLLDRDYEQCRKAYAARHSGRSDPLTAERLRLEQSAGKVK